MDNIVIFNFIPVLGDCNAGGDLVDGIPAADIELIMELHVLYCSAMRVTQLLSFGGAAGVYIHKNDIAHKLGIPTSMVYTKCPHLSVFTRARRCVLKAWCMAFGGCGNSRGAGAWGVEGGWRW